jgi:hypothetical protein
MDPYKATLSGPAPSPDSTKALPAATQSHSLAHAGAPSSGGATHPPILPPAIRQYFLPVRGVRPQEARVVYEARLFGSATVHFRDTKKKIDETRDLSILVPITNSAVPLDWNQVTFSDISADDLDAHPRESSTFADLPAAANQSKNYQAWEKHFADWVYRNHTLEIWKSPSLQTISQTGESERDFRVRLQQLAHESRDAETDKLRKKYAPKLTSIEDRIRRAQQTVDRETEQAKQQKLQTAISFGATLLSAFLGRKAVSGTSMGKATTAIRGLGRSMKESQDVGRASENVDALTQQLAALETEFKAEADALTGRWNPQEEALETVTVRPKKSDITIRLVGLCWAPFWMNPREERTPAWE